MPRVFISHASADRQAVEKNIVSLLKAHGIDCWYSTDNITTGEEWEKAIREALENCDWFLVVITPHAIKSKWVKTEVHWWINNRPDCLVPVLLEPCDPSKLHLMLQMRQ